MNYYWAYNEDGKPEPVARLPNGKLLCLGVAGPVTPDVLFVFVEDDPIPPPPPEDWTRDRSPKR